MRFKVVVRMQGCREVVLHKLIEQESSLLASQFHGNLWNLYFGWTDRFYSTMYNMHETSRRWQTVEVINWR